MAKVWKATSRIEHGQDDGGVVVFEVGDTVTGLNKEQMKQLWDSGALEEATVADSKGSDAPAVVNPALGGSDEDGADNV